MGLRLTHSAAPIVRSAAHPGGVAHANQGQIAAPTWRLGGRAALARPGIAPR